jgi:DNA-binding YbaB/EbfC family protein
MKNPMGNMGNILKQAQAMQAKMAKVQEEASTKTVTGTAGGGSVAVTANGAMQLVGIVIDPEVVKSGDVEMVQDLVLAASNDALKKAREMMAEEMKSVTGGRITHKAGARVSPSTGHRPKNGAALGLPYLEGRTR